MPGREGVHVPPVAGCAVVLGPGAAHVRIRPRSPAARAAGSRARGHPAGRCTLAVPAVKSRSRCRAPECACAAAPRRCACAARPGVPLMLPHPEQCGPRRGARPAPPGTRPVRCAQVPPRASSSAPMGREHRRFVLSLLTYRTSVPPSQGTRTLSGRRPSTYFEEPTCTSRNCQICEPGGTRTVPVSLMMCQLSTMRRSFAASGEPQRLCGRGASDAGTWSRCCCPTQPTSSSRCSPHGGSARP